LLFAFFADPQAQCMLAMREPHATGHRAPCTVLQCVSRVLLSTECVITDTTETSNEKVLRFRRLYGTAPCLLTIFS